MFKIYMKTNLSFWFPGIFLTGMILFFFLPSLAKAQVERISLSVADNVSIQGSNVNDGDIIAADGGLYKKSTLAYDANLAGVVSFTAAISFNREASPSGAGKFYPLVSKGNAHVWVSTDGGPIKKGDLITSSTKPGVGMKATLDGYILGSALEDFNGPAGALKKIEINLNMRPVYSGAAIKRSLKDLFDFSKLAASESPSVFFKYVLAAFVLFLSCASGFLLFGRIAAKGIDALARNPLMGSKIQLGIVINTVITICFVAAGVLLAFMIIRI